ncbi:hypothetical protein EIK77_004028 [Talaromyces pinophilus]|nr:hypothetical protein EIK77_004028 [Talaromyces pinophilus]
MAVHIFDAEDSDGDSWMEVVEGSPGPSMRNSSASLLYNRDGNVDSTRKTASWVADDTWVALSGKGAENSSADAESSPPFDFTKDKAQPVDPHHVPTLAHSQPDQRLCLDRPEVGDIKRHFNEVQSFAAAQPRKGLYYRLWLCWMYRMEWPQIEHTAQHAPDYISKDVEDDSGRTVTQELLRTLAIDRRYFEHAPPSASHVETRYPASYGRIVERDNIRPDSSTMLRPHKYPSTPPTLVDDSFSFLVRTYKSFGSPRSNRAAQGAISFQTWIHWMHQVNLQPSSKQWAGHAPWPSGSPSVSSLTQGSPWSSFALKNIGDVAYEYVKDIGLPDKAAAYYQSVSYI